MEEGPRSISLREEWTLSTPPNAIENGVVVDKRAVGELIKAQLRKTNCPITSAAVSLPMAQAMVRWIDMPVMDIETLQTAGAFEARKYLPYPAESAEIVLSPLGDPATNAETMRALLTAIPKDVLSSRAESLERAGIEMNCGEIECFPFLRANREPENPRSGFWRGQSQAYLLLGNENSSMIIVQSGEPVFVRSFAWGSGRLTQTLADEAKVSLEEASEIFGAQDTGLNVEGTLYWGEPSMRRFCEPIANELQKLDREIARLISYYRSLFPERSYEGAIGRLTVGGGLGNLSGLPGYFNRTLQIPSRAARMVPETAPTAGSVREAVASSAGLCVAYGLALGHFQNADKKTAHASREHVWRRAA